MSQTPQHKLSRRDAMKILAAAAGAATLANLPSKWTKPQLEVGVLPAHAQTSTLAAHTLAAGLDDPAANFCFDLISTVSITPPTPGILMHYVITLSNSSTTLSAPAALTGTIATDASGIATLTITVDTTSIFGPGDTITVTWSFANPSDGVGSGSQVFTSSGGGC